MEIYFRFPSYNYFYMLAWIIELPIWDKIYMILIAVAISITSFRYYQVSFNVRPFLWLSVLHLLTEIASNYISYTFHKNNLVVYHILAPIEYIIICTIFYRTFTSSLLKNSIVISSLLYLILTVLLALFWEGINQNNSAAFMVESTLVTLWCFFFFRFILRQEGSYRPERDRLFWLVVGLLFYFIGNFFVMGLMNYFIEHDMSMATKVYYASYAFYYMLYGMIGLLFSLSFSSIKYT